MKLTYLLPKFTREKLSELACNLPETLKTGNEQQTQFGFE